MASGVQGTSLGQVYSSRGAPASSVVLHAWKEVGKWGDQDPSSKVKRLARTFAYLCAGTWGALELTGRGASVWAVRNSFSKLFARSFIPIVAPAKHAEKAQESYEKARYFVGKSFDECVHGTSQCFRSVIANQFYSKTHAKGAIKLKKFLDQEEVGKTVVLMLETIDPLLLVELCKGIASKNPAVVAATSATLFINFIRPAIAKILPHMVERAQPRDFSVHEEGKIAVQMLMFSQIKDVNLLTFIPQLFKEMDPFFEDHICPITRESIRFVKEVKGNNGSSVWYEEQAIAKWLLENPKKAPPDWPKKIPYEKSALRDNLKMQLEINGRMEVIIEKLLEKTPEIALNLIEVDFLKVRNN